MKRFVTTLLIGLGLGISGWAQQEDAVSSDPIDQLLRRIERLEQTVQELRQQMQAQDASEDSPSEAPAASAAQALVQTPSQDTPRNDPGVKISGLLFGDYYWVASNHNPGLEDRNGFWVRRSYLTFDKPLGESLDMRLRFEMNSAGDFTSRSKLEPFVKDAYLRWKFSGNHSTYLGLSSTHTWQTVESHWGYRQVEKTVLDLQRLGSSRELGVAFRGSFDSQRKVRYHFQVANGAGTGSESDAEKKVLFSLGLYPTESVVLEFYTDYDNRPLDEYRRTFQGFVGFKQDWGRLGVQYAHQTRNGDPDLELDAFSVYGVWKLSQRASLFGRYDRMLDPNPDGARISYIPFDPTAESNLFIAGVDLRVNNQFSLIPNLVIIRYDKREDGTQPSTDFIPRMTFFYNF